MGFVGQRNRLVEKDGRLHGREAAAAVGLVQLIDADPGDSGVRDRIAGRVWTDEVARAHRAQPDRRAADLARAEELLDGAGRCERAAEATELERVLGGVAGGVALGGIGEDRVRVGSRGAQDPGGGLGQNGGPDDPPDWAPPDCPGEPTGPIAPAPPARDFRAEGLIFASVTALPTTALPSPAEMSLESTFRHHPCSFR